MKHTLIVFVIDASSPIDWGGPGRLLTRMTPVAPAFCAFKVFVLNVQTPRSIKAMWPVNAPAGNAEQPLCGVV